MALRLYAATTSKGKLRDFRTAAEAHSICIEPLPGLEKTPAPEEDGLTFAANATLKAVYYSRLAPGEWVLADDSGLEVDALAGAPGVRSARFAADAGTRVLPTNSAVVSHSCAPKKARGWGTGHLNLLAGTVAGAAGKMDTDTLNNLVLLQRLAGVPQSKRTARYRCVLAVALDGKLLHTAEGAVEGLILEAPRGTGGFGYDPLFYLPALGLTMAEIDLETKHGLSHRGRAIAALLDMLGV
jgi:XTP/dITP diphosphohydrolase